MEKKTLQQLRSEIASIDACIFSEIQKRKVLAQAIAERKHARKFPLRDENVEAEVCRRNIFFGKKLGLEESFVLRITKLLIAQSVKWQKEYLQTKTTLLCDVGSRGCHPRIAKQRKGSDL